MKHFARALAALVAVTLLACGMAAAEGTLDEAAFLGLWDFVEAEMDGQSATAEELDFYATLELEPGAAAFINDGSPSFYSTRMNGDALVLSNDTGNYACRLDERGYLYMVVAANAGEYVTMYFEKLEDYDGGYGDLAGDDLPEDDLLEDYLLEHYDGAHGDQAGDDYAEDELAEDELAEDDLAEDDPGSLVNALLHAIGADDGAPAPEPTEVPQESDENGFSDLVDGGDDEAMSAAEAVNGLMDMCRGDADTYMVREYPEQGWALIASTLESKDTSFVHKYESDYRYSTTAFFLTINDYQTDDPKVEPELMISYSRDDAPLNITGVTIAFGGRSFTFTGDLSYNQNSGEHGYTEYVHLTIDQHNQSFLGALAQYILDIGGDDPESLSMSNARATIILHGDEDVEAELGEGFFQDYARVIVDPLSRFDLASCFYEDRGVQMTEGVR